MRNRTVGFTLVELMVVVLIIGILVAIAVPVFNAAKANAERGVCFANQRQIEGVFEQYAADTGDAPPAWVAASYFVGRGYLKKEPVCPSWARDSTHHYTPSSHHYYFIENSRQVSMYRPTKTNASVNEGIIGCFADIAGHGYYRTPGVN